MRTIHKYRISEHEDIISMPRNADILCVQMQRGAPELWALVDTEQPEEARLVITIGTGWDVPPHVGRSDYIGTYQTDGGFVWHVFAPKPNALGLFERHDKKA